MARSVRAVIYTLVLLCALPLPACAEDSSAMEFRGYSRNFIIISDQTRGETAEAIALLRLRLDGDISHSARFELAYELAPWYRDIDGDAVPVGAAQSTALEYRVDDLEHALYPDDPDLDEEFVVLQNLDRAVLYYSAAWMDLTLGRQAVAFGSARAVNPTDVLAPYAYSTLAKEERFGVDALRMRIPTQRLGELDLGIVAGEDARAENSAAFMRLRSYIKMTDITLMAMAFRENELLGLDITRAVGGAGTWVEAAYVYAEAGPDEDYFRASVGLDYSLTEDLYAWAEYHYNGPGSRDKDEYNTLESETAYTEGGVYLLGQNYLAPGFTYQLTPLLVLGFEALWNLDDGSALLAPSLEYSLADDATARLGGYAGAGRAGSGRRSPDEFRQYPDVWYASVNFYF